MKTVMISEEEYKRLKQKEKVDAELVDDIAKGIRDILAGKIREI